MVQNNQESCLVQVNSDASMYEIKVSLGYVGLKNTEGPYADPRQCFFKDGPSITLKVKTNNPQEHFSAAVSYLKRIGINRKIDVEYDPTNSFETEEPNHVEVFMGTGIEVASPQVAYTRNIGTCLGIGFYNPKTKKGSLSHIDGAEDSSVKNLADLLDKECDRLGEGINAHFVSGLATIDNKSLNEIFVARQKAEKLFTDYQQKLNKVEMTLCQKVGEYIKLFSLDAKTGLFTAEIDIVPHDRLVKMDIMASKMQH